MNRFQFKLLLAGLMVLDHISFFIPSQLSIIFHILTRCVAVGFAWLAVEGFHYTSNPRNYLVRLYLAGIGMQMGNMFLNALFSQKQVIVYNNIFLTLALGLTLIWLAKTISSKSFKVISITILLVLGTFFTEGGMVVLPFILLTYYSWNQPKKQYLWYLLFSLILLFLLFIVPSSMDWWTTVILNPDFFFISVIPLLCFYNGQEGVNHPFSKYFFYLFYPLHLWLIAFITFLLK